MLRAAELKSLLSKYRISPKKYLGQNFLVDSDVVEDIIEMCGFTKADWVIEIGPGLGALTGRLAGSVKKVIAVEKDRKLCPVLGELMKDFNNVKIVCEDFLEFDLNSILTEAPPKIKVIGNLPYYITTPIIEKLIAGKDNFSSVFITIQKEVAERICAGPGTKAYGSLSCFVQFYFKPSVLLKIGKHAFYPQPEVDSAFMELKVLPKPPVEVKSNDTFFGIIKAGFGQRRKTLLNSLLSSEHIKLDKAGLSALLKTIGIDPNIRAEELSLEDFARIANALP